jgi:hypothetical protein
LDVANWFTLAARETVDRKLFWQLSRDLLDHKSYVPAKVEAVEITSELMAAAVLLQETQCGAQAAAACQEYSLALA